MLPGDGVGRTRRQEDDAAADAAADAFGGSGDEDEEGVRRPPAMEMEERGRATLGYVRNPVTIDNPNSEGNRFITSKDL